jgi:hypothetical protein
MLSSCHTCRKSAPFRVGQVLNPYPQPLQPGIRFLQHHLPAPPFFTLTSDRLHLPEHCTQRRGIQAYHVPQVLQIDRVRAPLYTDWDDGCVGLPSKLTDLPSIAILALGPNGSSSPALLTIRNAKASLTLPIPTIPQGSACVLLADISFTRCLKPRRCQRRIPSSRTGDTTPV